MFKAAVLGVTLVVMTACSTVEAGTIYVSTAGNDANDGRTWGTAKRSVTAGLGTAVSGDQVWVAGGTYVERVALAVGVELYGGFADGETDLAQRNWRTNLTILDGNQAGSVVTAPTGATASTRIDGFVIRNGKADSGGGIYCESSSSPIIANNTIIGNTASYGGGGIYCYSSSSPTIANNTITGSKASDGGGIYCCYNSSPTITNNTIASNMASSHGGGICCYSSSSPAITNTIIAFNSSGVFCSFGTPTLRYCCVYGNSAYDYSGLTDPTGTNGNISVDPQLADVGSYNVHLQPSSPCIDAADDTAVQAGWVDMDGQARKQGAHVDIGADESDGSVWPAAPAILYVSPSGSDCNDGLSWATAKRTVQAGVDAGGSGSQVWVAAGTYVGSIRLRFGIALYGGFAGSETELAQRSWRTNITILDGNQDGSVVTTPPAATESTRIDGFTIRNGKATYGGGIYCHSSSPMIANNTITGNSASNYGGGIHCESSSPTIANNIITANMAPYGGGIHCYYSSSPTITNNIITVNTAPYGGGGIFCYFFTSPTITSNTIIGNTSSDGGGICCYSSSSPAIANTIIAFNSSGIYSSSGAPTLRYCCVYGNSVYNYSGLTDATGTDGNISVDPQLADLGKSNVHLQPTSPCMDAGEDAAVQAGWTDIDGQARVQGAHVDIGADESDGTLWPPTVAIFYVSPSGSDSNDGLSWATAKQTVQAGIDAGGTGSQVWVAAGTYVGTIRLGFGIALYGGFAGSETDLSQRNWRTNVTILDGNQAGSAVTTPPGATTSTRIDGFTIRNSKGSYYGGGIYCYSSPTIANNTITGNSGGGIVCDDHSSPTVSNNAIAGNSGGGVVCGDHSSPTIANNTIAGNSGGGIYCDSFSSPTITNNTITTNTITGNTASGGGIYCGYSGSPTITNNTITGNTASYGYGGGIYCNSCSPTITNNTITNNTASYGGGIFCSGSSPTISNTIIAFNSSGIYGGTPALRNNCVYGNSAYNYAGLTDPTGTNGNISVDPQLADVANGDVHLQAGSPCIDAGDDTVVQAGWTDIDGQARVQGAHVDIGADESDGTLWPPDPAILYVNPNGSDGNDGLSWASAKQTVQAALDAGGSGTQVWVAAGTYVGTIRLRFGIALYGGFAGGETELSQRNCRTNLTILDGNQAGSVVTAPEGAAASTRIDGFVIRNGNASCYGGGVYCYYSCPTITNNTITDNTASSDDDIIPSCGGGIYCYSSSPTIADNTITGNTASEGSGAGIYCDSSSPTITNNTITGNTASYGGGICCRSSSPTITNNTITGNTSSSSGGGILCSSFATITNNIIAGNSASGHGGGIYCSAATITNNTITGNSASDCGGGIYCGPASPTIANNTITGNTASEGGGICCRSSSSPSITNNTITGNAASYHGGGIYCEASSSPTITNTIIAFNASGIYCSSGAPTVRYCCVYGNDAYNYSGMTDPAGSNGNISVDPQLADVGSYSIHLQPTSPCVDAGDDAVVQASWVDMDGQARVQGAHVDIGADESDGTLWPQGPAIIYVSPSGSDGNDGLSWATAKQTVQAAVSAGGTGTQVWVATGTYVGKITLTLGVALYGGFAGTETDLAQRNWVTNKTILDGNQSGSVVMAPPAARASTRIDGFTIRNGKADYGGGISCSGSSPTIANNTITGNTADYGGGISCDSSSSATIANNTIAANTTGHLYGGGIYCSGSSPTISNNIIAGNTAFYGGGIFCDSSCSPTITNNTITGNTATYGGGGIDSYSSLTITNTIIAFNSSGIYGRTPTLRNNCVYGNSAYNYAGLTDPTGTNGNISADPQLADVARGNLHLQATSPCVNAGDDTAVQTGGVDMDGQARTQGTHVDIGADESDGTLWPSAPAILYVSPSGSDSNDGLSWATAKQTVQAGIDAGGTGSQVWVAAGTYVGTIRLGLGMALYGGFAGNETNLSQRNWRMNVTILDGNQAGSVVTAPPAAAATTRIDGFTIRNGAIVSIGNGQYCGGGIYCSDSCSPTITNNIISGNTAPCGGGICCEWSSSPAITNNTITGNTASYGGGIYCNSASPIIVGNTITGNSTSYGGGGICCEYSSPTITNTIIAFNGSGVSCYFGTPTVRYCCVYGNSAYNYSGLTSPTGFNGNISVDPLFVASPGPGPDGNWGTADDIPGDLHLSSASPCINGGDPAYVPVAGETDMDGLPRIIHGRIDIGAYEYRGPLAGDINGDGVVGLADLKLLVAAWNSWPGQPNWNPNADIDADGAVILADLKILVANWNMSVN